MYTCVYKSVADLGGGGYSPIQPLTNVMILLNATNNKSNAKPSCSYIPQCGGALH